MPGPRCKICGHKQRGAAEAAITAGESVRSVAKRLKLPYQSLDRHTRRCVPKALKVNRTAPKVDKEPAEGCQSTVRELADRAVQERDNAFADCLLNEVEMLHRTTLDLLRECRQGCWLEIPDRDDPNKKQKVYD